MVSKVRYLSKATLNGVAQIMFQENLLTGIIIVIGVAVGSLNFAVALLLSSFSGAFTADLIEYDKGKIEQGLYSFSAALVGVAALLFFRSHLITWSFVIIGGALAALIQHLSIKKGVAIYTLPFVLVTWLAISLAHTLYPSLIVGAGELTSSSYDAFLFPLKGIGQVIFQGKLSTAIFFFLALLISSPRVALWAVGAALLSGACWPQSPFLLLKLKMDSGASMQYWL